MTNWLDRLATNPLPTLLTAGEPALAYFTRRDLLDEPVNPIEGLWDLPPARRLLHKQQGDGSWRYPGQSRQKYPETNYDLLETFRCLRILVEKYGFRRENASIARAAEYVFSCQTGDGDIRGILGTQTMPYYHGAITELLIKAGYGDDPRVEIGIEWLLSVRQDDGGWIIPMQAVPAREKTREIWSAPHVPLDRSLPFSHLATGMALRAFAAHPRYRNNEAAQAAARCLKSRFFQADKYNDRKAPGYWFKFQYPFWWSNLLTALDSLSLMGFSLEDEDVQAGLAWFVEHQQPDLSGLSGLWAHGYEQKKHKEPSPREREEQLWVALAVCRVFKRFHC